MSSHFRFAVLMCGAAVCCLLVEAGFAQTVHGVRSAAEDAAYRRIRTRLELRTQASWPRENLLQLQQRLRSEGVPVMIDRVALDDIGESPESLKLASTPAGVTLRSALQLRLEQADLAYMIRNETLLITTEEEAEYRLDTRIYNVARITPIEQLPTWGGGSIQGRDFDSLIQLITSSIAPDSWDEVGGPGSIEPYGAGQSGLLVISQTEVVHQRIESLIANMERAMFGGARPPQPRGVIGVGSTTIPRSSLRRSSLTPSR